MRSRHVNGSYALWWEQLDDPWDQSMCLIGCDLKDAIIDDGRQLKLFFDQGCRALGVLLDGDGEVVPRDEALQRARCVTDNELTI